jgi:hypothetical protein
MAAAFVLAVLLAAAAHADVSVTTVGTDDFCSVYEPAWYTLTAHAVLAQVLFCLPMAN